MEQIGWGHDTLTILSRWIGKERDILPIEQVCSDICYLASRSANIIVGGQEVYAPCDGLVVQAVDGFAERTRTNLFSDLSNAYKHAHDFDPAKDDVQAVAGNYVVLKCGDAIYAALVHLQNGSVQVAVGQQVKKGDVLGRVGHSGNSFAPHLHFQLMDSCDLSTAKGLPCAFAQYEVFQDGAWKTVTDGIPKSKDRIRFEKPEALN